MLLVAAVACLACNEQIYVEEPSTDAPEVEKELCAVAEVMAETDLRMLRLREKIDLAEDEKSEDEELFERFARIGFQI